jgi:hypothetical protein
MSTYDDGLPEIDETVDLRITSIGSGGIAGSTNATVTIRNAQARIGFWDPWSAKINLCLNITRRGRYECTDLGPLHHYRRIAAVEVLTTFPGPAN